MKQFLLALAMLNVSFNVLSKGFEVSELADIKFATIINIDKGYWQHVCYAGDRPIHSEILMAGDVVKFSDYLTIITLSERRSGDRNARSSEESIMLTNVSCLLKESED